MKIKGTNLVEVEIDKSQQLEIVEEYLSHLFDIPKECFLEGNEILYWEEQNMGTHSDAEKRLYRRATVEDKTYFEFLGIVYNMLTDK